MGEVSATSASDYKYVGKNTTSADESNINLDAETFLALMVAQMQYQDPLEPQTDSDFLAQLAQVSSTELMQEMSTSLNSSKVYNMIGKYVYASVTDSETGDSTAYQGVVESVINNNGSTYVVIGNNAVASDSVLQVYDSDSVGTGSLESYSGLLGKYVSATYEDSKENAITVTGTVESVYSDNSVIFLGIKDSSGNTQNVAAFYVNSVSDSAPATTTTAENTTAG